jgi:hypothetical protein
VFCWFLWLLVVALVSGVGCWALLFAVVVFVLVIELIIKTRIFH